MEIGAFFILLVLLVVLASLGGAVYAIAMWLRAKQLDPRGDRVERGARERARGRSEADEQRPEHVEVESEQRARFIGSR